MKHVLFTILAAMFAITAMAQSDGSSCEKAIYVDSLMVQSVEANTTYWFTANTDDLPLTVYFFPDEESELAPEIYIDFTCEPGVYEDQNIKDIVDLAADLEIYFPFGIPFDTIEVDGATAYRVSYERDLLELLVMLGIDYSVPVYVQFRSPVAGSAQVSNIKTVTDCSALHQRVEIQDTIYLQANKPGLVYFPVTEWKDKNMSFIWNGEGSIRAYLEPDCEFDTLTSDFVYTFENISSDGYLMQTAIGLDIDNYIRYSNDGNMYVLFVADGDGEVYVTDYIDHGSVTINTCINNLKSTVITFPTAVDGLALTAKIPTKSYRIQASEIQNKNIRLKWKTTENKLAVAYFANFCGFELKASDPDVLDTVHFVYNETEQAMIAEMPMERVNKLVRQNTDGWLFMQIYRQEAGTFWWDSYEVVEPGCDEKSILLMPNDSAYMPANYYNTSYKMPVNAWDGYAYTFTWKGTRKAYIFIADTCSFPLAPFNMHVGKYMELNPNTSVELSKEDMARLAANYADADGQLYLRLRSDAEGSLVTSQIEVIDLNACIQDAHSFAMDFPSAEGGVKLAATSAKPYRFQTAALKDNNVRLTWQATNNSPVVAYFADFCGFELDANAPEVVDTVHLAYNAELQAMVADMPMERVNRLVEKNADGWLFMQLDRQEAGTFYWNSYEIIIPECSEISTLILPNDTVDVPANSDDISYMLLPADWVGYQYAFTWQGTSKLELFVADTCSFALSATDARVVKHMEIAPNTTEILTREEVALLPEFTDADGYLYLRLRSTAVGTITIAQQEVIDMEACLKDAHSSAIAFPTAQAGLALAAELANPYRFQASTIQDKNIRLTWKATANHPVVAYFTNFCGFELDANAPEVVDTVHLAYNAELQAMVAELPIERVNRLAQKNADGWLFMQLDRQEAGTFWWENYEIIIPECSEISTLILPNDTVDVPANSEDISYMLLPADWVGYQYAFTWQGTSKLELFVADTCSFALSATDARVVKYLEIAPNTTVILTREEVALLPEFADADGYLYLRLHSTAAGAITIEQQEVIDMEACLKDAHSSSIAFPTAQAGLALAAELANPYRFQASTIQDKNIRLTWKATANHPVVAYFTNFCTFELDATAPEVLDTVHLAYNAELQAMVAELPIERVNRLAQKNADGWLFMQLDRQEAGTFWWENYEIILPTCDETSTLLSPNTSVTVRANNDVSYKLQVADWLGYNHSLTWRAASKAELFIADTCTFTLLATDAHVLKYMELEPNVTVELTKEELASLAETYMDDFGNIYLRIRGNATGALVMAQSAGTGLSAYPSMDGRTTQLVMINQSLYIQVQTANSTEYYDLTGRKVKIME